MPWLRYIEVLLEYSISYRALPERSEKGEKGLRAETTDITGGQMEILSLDLATKTGWATNALSRASGTIEFALKRGESPGMRFLRCRAWLNEIHKLTSGRLDVLCYEQAHHRGGAATAVCVGLVTVAQSFAAEHDIELMPVHTATLKKWATGSGRVNKQDMIAAAIERGWKPVDDNEADAQLLLDYATNELDGGQ
jgi:crossover junction endodeoxyribonuclease RuvC